MYPTSDPNMAPMIRQSGTWAIIGSPVIAYPAHAAASAPEIS